MVAQYEKKRYIDVRGYSILHTVGTHAGDSTLPYLHYSRTYMLLYFRRGTGSIKIEGRRYAINEGDVIILNPSEIFQFSVDDKEYHERMTMTINEALFSSYPNATASLFASFVNRKKGVGNLIPAETVKLCGIDDYLDQALDFASSPEDINQLFAFCCISKILSLLGEVVAADSEMEVKAVSNPLIGEVLEYLNLHITEDFAVSDVAAEFNIDKSYLSHLFKEHVGMSLWTYVVVRRLQKFNSLIVDGNSIEEAAFLSGFKNYSNFFRLYKKHMGISPTEFKKQIRRSAKSVNTRSL